MTQPVCGARDTQLRGTPVEPCDLPAGHDGPVHRGYAPIVDEVVFWRVEYWKLREDPDWRPYCLACRSMARMTREGDTFRCQACRIVVNVQMEEVRDDVRRST